MPLSGRRLIFFPKYLPNSLLLLLLFFFFFQTPGMSTAQNTTEQKIWVTILNIFPLCTEYCL